MMVGVRWKSGKKAMGERDRRWGFIVRVAQKLKVREWNGSNHRAANPYDRG